MTCLPKDLPEFIEVDMAEMSIGDTVLLSGLNMPEGVEVSALIAGADDLPVVSVHSGHAGGDEEEYEAEEGAEGETAGEE